MGAFVAGHASWELLAVRRVLWDVIACMRGGYGVTQGPHTVVWLLLLEMLTRTPTLAQRGRCCIGGVGGGIRRDGWHGDTGTLCCSQGSHSMLGVLGAAQTSIVQN